MIPVEYRVTRPMDFVRFGVALNDGVRALGWTAWAGRRAVAMGGIVVDRDNTAMGHFSVTDDYREKVVRQLHRRTLVLLRRLSRTRVQSIWATCDADTPRAAEWMKRLGFLPTEREWRGSIVHERELHP